MGRLHPHTALVLGAFALLPACTADSDTPSVVLDGSGFFGAPWPDNQRTVDGRPDLSGFPLRGEISIIDDYATQIEALNGFGTNAPVFVPLNGPVDDLPSAKETASAEGSVLLIDIDPSSPERGTIIPTSITTTTTTVITTTVPSK